MHKLSFLVKSYKDDKAELKELLISFNKFNKDKIPLFCIVPESDIEHFAEFTAYSNLKIDTEESIFHKFSIPSSSDGYINQQIIKLSFYKTQYTENYFCIDSDAEFIRDFYLSDFLLNEEPYLFTDFDCERYSDNHYFKNYGISRINNIKKIRDYIGINDTYFPNIHGMTILNADVLMDFEMNFLRPNNFDYVDILRISPLEFSWYMAWIEKKFPNVFKIHPTIFKTYHTENDVIRDLVIDSTYESIANNFIGVVVNSNFRKYSGNINFLNLNKISLTKKALFRLIRLATSMVYTKLKRVIQK